MAEEPKEEFSQGTLLIRLVALIMAVLAIVITLVLFAPPWGEESTNATAVMEYRKGNLGLVTTAFGAWIGAAVAFLFSNEFFRQAATTMSGAGGISAEDKLWQIAVGKLPLKSIPLIVGLNQTINDINDAIKKDPNLWFITVLDTDGKFKTVFHKDAISIYTTKTINKLLIEDPKGSRSITDLMNTNVNGKLVSDLLAAVGEGTQDYKKYIDIYIKTDLFTTVGLVYNQLKEKKVTLGIVVDEKVKPTQFFEISDIEKLKS